MSDSRTVLPRMQQMKVFLVGLIFLLTACSMVVGDTCDPEELSPYSKEYSKELLQGCSKKCCGVDSY